MYDCHTVHFQKPKKSEFDGISDNDLQKLIRAEVKFRKIETQKRIDAGLEQNIFAK